MGRVEQVHGPGEGEVPSQPVLNENRSTDSGWKNVRVGEEESEGGGADPGHHPSQWGCHNIHQCPTQVDIFTSHLETFPIFSRTPSRIQLDDIDMKH